MRKRDRIRLKIIDFWKKNKKVIIIIAIVYCIVLVINNILKINLNKQKGPSTTYTPHVSVMDSTKEVPKVYREKIENIVEKYFNYCNNGEYENAYSLITDDCKKYNYPTIESFKGYVNAIFGNKKKIYNLQSYSIVNNKYIYNIRILDDILANGTTDGYSYYEEKIVLTEENGEMKLSIAEFIEDEQPNIIIEDDYMIVKVLNKVIDYKTETYTFEITNKTDNYIVIADGTQNNELCAILSGEERNPEEVIDSLIISPNSFVTKDVKFVKYYDDGRSIEKFNLGAIRVFKNYSVEKKTTEEDMNTAVKLYSMEVDLR